jgi:hypothetical protein
MTTTKEQSGEVKGKTLDITSVKDAKKKVSDLKVFGDGDAWQLLCKASSEQEGWMKSTKVLNIEGEGCLVQVSTQQRNPDGSNAIAEAICFVPKVELVISDDGKSRKLEGIY